ncbi:hypothetical protein CPB83DRAFT_899764 [Crepidotus variabilis]|uniref:Uncharacterized protein n=1 Tax=Crepidotus variabilis TaxID=179855 RepID=A0A9P6JIH1_9AGAR|nr:hypothetical protein CPB83DRAFT_899764 [Crepidotus variabilis]
MPKSLPDNAASAERKRHAKRVYYEANLEQERCKARERATKRLATETSEERNIRLERHRQAQARYRETNRLVLKSKSWQSRKDMRYLRNKKNEESEYQAIMALAGEASSQQT